MANIDHPHGFVPANMMDGSKIPVRRFPVDSSNAANIFKGDLVIVEADGNIAVHGTPGSNVAKCLGAVVGIYDANGHPVNGYNSLETTLYLPSSTAGFVDVALALPGALFEVQASSGAAVAETARFSGSDHTAGSGNTSTGVSGYELNSTLGQAQCKIVDKVDRPGNDWTTHVDLLVVFGETYWAPAAVAAGV